jgi:hypothetical protein
MRDPESLIYFKKITKNSLVLCLKKHYNQINEDSIKGVRL